MKLNEKWLTYVYIHYNNGLLSVYIGKTLKKYFRKCKIYQLCFICNDNDKTRVFCYSYMFGFNKKIRIDRKRML